MNKVLRNGRMLALLGSLFLVAAAVNCGNPGVDGTGQHDTDACPPGSPWPEPSCSTTINQDTAAAAHQALLAAGQPDPCAGQSMEVAKEADEGIEVRCEEQNDMQKADKKGLACMTDQTHVAMDQVALSRAKTPGDIASAQHELTCDTQEQMEDCNEAQEGRDDAAKHMAEQKCDDDKNDNAICKKVVCLLNQANKALGNDSEESESTCDCTSFSNGACNGVDNSEVQTAATACADGGGSGGGGDSGAGGY